jgi:hypothetical protein
MRNYLRNHLRKNALKLMKGKFVYLTKFSNWKDRQI